MHLASGHISVMELDVLSGVPATDHVLANLALPRQSLIAAVMREGYVHVPGADDRLEPDDTVVALVEDSAEDELLAQFGSG